MAVCEPGGSEIILLSREATDMKTFGLFWIAIAAGLAQAASHAVTLSWQDTLNPTGAGTTYSVYRSTGLCSGTPTFSKVASAVTTMTYEDTTVTPGNYCYEVTAVLNGMESAPSNTAAAAVPSFAPTQLQVVVR